MSPSSKTTGGVSSSPPRTSAGVVGGDHQSGTANTSFYKQRGVKIHSLEVTGYKCADDHTAEVLGQIIQETTNRMNKLQQQESENEVQLFKIEGDINEETKRADLLQIQKNNSDLQNQIDGSGEAEKVKFFLSALEKDVPQLSDRIHMWNTLRKQD